MSYVETEIKLHVNDLNALAHRLLALGATQTFPRTHEMNLRFDTPAGTLSAQACVLRLRQDAQSKLTFKGPSLSEDGVAQREEIEFAVSDFEAAHLFLERLGYQVVNVYEKYRTTYKLDNLHIMLDEMPYGDFIEIEGESVAEIRTIAENLSLNFDAAVKASYLEVFERLVSEGKTPVQSLTFDAFAGKYFDLGRISIFSADSLMGSEKSV